MWQTFLVLSLSLFALLSLDDSKVIAQPLGYEGYYEGTATINYLAERTDSDRPFSTGTEAHINSVPVKGTFIDGSASVVYYGPADAHCTVHTNEGTTDTYAENAHIALTGHGLELGGYLDVNENDRYCSFGFNSDTYPIKFQPTSDGNLIAQGNFVISGPENCGTVPFTISCSIKHDWNIILKPIPSNNDNHPPNPVIEVSPSNTVDEGTTVTLDGSKSNDPDPGDRISSYTWRQIDGPDIGLGISQSPSIHFTAPTVNQDTVFTFSLGVSDTHSDSATIAALITVKPSHPLNHPAYVDAGPNQVVNSGESITLHGTATDIDNDPLQYKWDQLSGTPVQWTSAQNILQPTFTAPTLDENKDANNVLQFQLGVDDGHGHSVVTVTTVMINHPPTAVLNISPSNTVGILDTVTFDAHRSSDPDPGDKIVSFDWQQKKTNPNDPDVPIVFRSANSDVIKFTAPSVNKETKVTFTLSLRDKYDAITVTEASVLVKPGNRPPIAVAQEREDGVYVVFDGSKSNDPDPGDKVVSYKWIQIDNTGVKADLRGKVNDPNQYFIKPNVNQRTILSFSLKVTDTHGDDSQNDATINILVNPCTSAEIQKVSQIEKELQRDISALRQTGSNVAADTLEIWMTGNGAKLYPQDHPRQLSTSWLSTSIEVHLAQNAIHDLFQGPHNKGAKSVNSLSAFIDGLPNDRKGYDFSDNWDYAIPSGVRLTDYNIAVGGSQIHADGKFVATKGQFVPNGVTVSGVVQYSLLDRFDWNKDTMFPSLSLTLHITDQDLNLLEKCGHAAPFWSAGAWKQSVQGLGQDLPNSPPHMTYNWRDRND